ncbi:MAG: DUF1549 and DUF1553 domain-containing protein [Pirellulales bacterium]|nr:DUF1549 and DUF1553 domain-containing protein [Pirellulales bacterium]
MWRAVLRPLSPSWRRCLGFAVLLLSCELGGRVFCHGAEVAASSASDFQSRGQSTLDYVTADAAAVLALRPNDVLDLPLLRVLQGYLDLGVITAPLPLTFIDQYTAAFLKPDPSRPPGRGLVFDLNIFRTRKAIDWEKKLKALSGQLQPVSFKDTTYYRISSGRTFFWPADAYHFVVADEWCMQRAIDRGPAEMHDDLPWSNVWPKIAQAPIVVAIDPAWVLPKLDQVANQGPAKMIGPAVKGLLKDAQSLACTMHLDGSNIHAETWLTCADEEAAKKRLQGLKSMLGLAKQLAFPKNKPGTPVPAPANGNRSDSAMTMVANLLAKPEFVVDGTSARIVAETQGTRAEGIFIVVSAANIAFGEIANAGDLLSVANASEETAPVPAGVLQAVEAAEAEAARAKGQTPRPVTDAWEAPRRTAARIDEQLAAAWSRAQIQPAALADEAELHRRVWLDLAGVIPPVAEVRAYLADNSSDKYERLIDRLLAGPLYPRSFAARWRSVLVPEAETNRQLANFVIGDEMWLQNALRANQPYDALVRAFVEAPLGTEQQPTNPFAASDRPAAPLGYYFAKQGKPENIAAGITRAFLGVRVECAQCHDHPFADWKRKQFWGLAAFFAGIAQQQPGNQFSALLEKPLPQAEIVISGTEQIVPAAFIDDRQPDWKTGESPRAAFAQWLTSRENPWFARAAVNRVWAQLFGVGFVDPVDDFDPNNPPSHPEILELLAGDFVEHDFDLRHLLRSVLLTRAYRATSARQDETPVDPRMFNGMPLRGLTREQVLDSVAQATGAPASPVRFTQFFVINDLTESFLSSPDKPTEFEMSVAQALTLMNGQTVTGATSLNDSLTLMAAAELPGLTPQQRIETLYLATLSRPPRAEELQRLLAYVEAGEQRQALADVFWALLNSSEFLFNH